jgi:outer membrane protein assembly factor BamB
MRGSSLWVLAVLAACTDYNLTSEREPDDEVPPGEDTDAAPQPDVGEDTDVPVDSDEPPIDEEPELPPGSALAPMYAHTGSDLYAVDSASPYNRLRVGTFTLPGSFVAPTITDIAINAEGAMYALSYTTLYKVDATTAKLTTVAVSGYDALNALTFLADGTLLAGGGNALFKVDTATGAFTPIEAIGSWEFAGDMVGLPDGLLYCSMAPAGTEQSSLVVYDLATKTIVRTGSTGAGSLYGFAYAEERLFGFTGSGRMYEVNPETGLATQLQPAGPTWYGAATNPVKW